MKKRAELHSKRILKGLGIPPAILVHETLVIHAQVFNFGVNTLLQHPLHVVCRVVPLGIG